MSGPADASKRDQALKAINALKKDMENLKKLTDLANPTERKLNDLLSSLDAYFKPGADSRGATSGMQHCTNQATTGVNAALKKLRDTLTGKTLRDIIKSLTPIEKEMNEALETLKNHLEK
ncbi:uncharacterized protein LOC122295020 [Carya illinoinensis]|uniref:Uncharacterized protein n=1 Tax=Carya illinoinensis TaxID=32201 RepID=A0A8T1NCB2_CARIL|nr:uncharacterized protein LOC122295020 [Carya illinoinensis]KAG6629426.1 hypothetical protein CIPAW_14G083800 [Carya illinoinensis]